MKRMDKYIEDDNTIETSTDPVESVAVPKRSQKNVELYNKIYDDDLGDFTIGSNAKVIGESENNIDIGRIKEILEKNYQELPKRSKIVINEEKEDTLEKTLEQTREYDINTILEKARAEKEVDYEKDRLKKVRDTQFDILKSLELDNDERELLEKSEKPASKNNEELLNLINTITENELTRTMIENNTKEHEIENEITDSDIDPLDILTELRGNENTALLGAEELTAELEKLSTEKDSESVEKSTTNTIPPVSEDSFYSKSMSFDKDDFMDLYEDSEKSGILFKIIIILVVIAIIIGIVLFLNYSLNFNWF